MSSADNCVKAQFSAANFVLTFYIELKMSVQDTEELR